MLFRNKDGTFIEIKRSQFNNDKLYYSKIMNVKTRKEKKYDIQSAFALKETSKNVLYSKHVIDKLMLEFS
jgi:hypothetical protein